MRKNKYCTIYLVRHGQTEWNVKNIIQGHHDSPLTAAGIKLGQELGKKLKRIKFDQVFSSDLLRAHHTAKIIAAEHKLIIKTSKLLRERTFGSFEGKSFQEFNIAFAEIIKKYHQATDAEHMKVKYAPDIETPYESTTRLIIFLREISLAYLGKKVLVVSHGSLMRYLLVLLGYGTYKTLPPGSIENLAIIKLECDGVDFFVKKTAGVNIRPK